MRILIAPDKFKGTLTAHAAADVIARGWRKARPDDELELLPITDGGDGFGEVMSELLGAQAIKCKTVDAAHRPCKATWWWEAKTKTAIIESANVIGLAMLPPGKFHPFDSDTFGLGKVIQAAQVKGAKQILIGIGGSATNDGGFGLARALGWKFLDKSGKEILRWVDLKKLQTILRWGEAVGEHSQRYNLTTAREDARPTCEIIVAVDVQNPLLGPRGATRVYGPQKGLRPRDFALAERCLLRLADIFSGSLRPSQKSQRSSRLGGTATVPGAGAAGGLGFGLVTFLGAKLEPGFTLFSCHAQLARRLRKTDLVITSEGAIDRSTFMGKGVGEIARLCKELKIPCIGLGGKIERSLKRHFTRAAALTDLVSFEEAKTNAERWLKKLATLTARQCASREIIA